MEVVPFTDLIPCINPKVPVAVFVVPFRRFEMLLFEILTLPIPSL